MKAMKWSFALVLFLSAAGCGGSTARNALPSSATDIHEYYWDDGFQGDFVRCLRAKMTEADFSIYVNRLGLKERYETSKHENIPVHFFGRCTEPWWDPPLDLKEGAYFKYTPKEEYFQAVGYRNGYAYFVAAAW
ncbi:MAG: hypothetical protein JSS27_08595 [Planctomycetes bacterium]|nr:hypothetical protein [Planctomycetota bacterium]